MRNLVMRNVKVRTSGARAGKCGCLFHRLCWHKVILVRNVYEDRDGYYVLINGTEIAATPSHEAGIAMSADAP